MCFFVTGTRKKEKPKGGTFRRLAASANEMLFHLWSQLWSRNRRQGTANTAQFTNVILSCLRRVETNHKILVITGHYLIMNELFYTIIYEWSFHFFHFFSLGKDQNLNHRIQNLTSSFGNRRLCHSHPFWNHIKLFSIFIYIFVLFGFHATPTIHL